MYSSPGRSPPPASAKKPLSRKNSGGYGAGSSTMRCFNIPPLLQRLICSTLRTPINSTGFRADLRSPLAPKATNVDDALIPHPKSLAFAMSPPTCQHYQNTKSSKNKRQQQQKQSTKYSRGQHSSSFIGKVANKSKYGGKTKTQVFLPTAASRQSMQVDPLDESLNESLNLSVRGFIYFPWALP